MAARRAFDTGTLAQAQGCRAKPGLLRVADLIEQRAEELALLECWRTASRSPRPAARSPAAADLWRYAAALARELFTATRTPTGRGDARGGGTRAYGVVAIITPWNFPLLIVSQKLPFALAVGCTAVVKPSELTSGTTLLLGEILIEADPDGGRQRRHRPGRDVGATMVRHPAVDMISFTGSTAVGRSLATAAEPLKRVELELGGKNPQLVFADADLEAAVDAVVFGVYFNAGECCNSGSRVLVQREIAEDFLADVVARSRSPGRRPAGRADEGRGHHQRRAARDHRALCRRGR